MSASGPTASVYRGVYRRMHEIMADAPYSSFDLLGSLIAFGIGLYLTWMPDLFDRYGGLYGTLARWADEPWWGALFSLCGASGLAAVCWPARPPFGLRLLARMGVAFCLVAMAINHLDNSPPAAGAITHGVLSLASVWGILRTRHHGR